MNATSATSAEQAVIAAALLSAEALEAAVRYLPDAKAFYRHDHRVLWSAILEMRAQGRAVDVVTVAEWLGEGLGEAGGQAYVGELVSTVPGTANAAAYAETVAAAAAVRGVGAALAVAAERLAHDDLAEIHADLQLAFAEAAAPAFKTVSPADLFSDRGLPAFPPDVLPAALRDFAFDRAELIGCDPAAIAIPALVACGALLPDAVTIQPKARDRTWQESARLWALVVGPPAAKKSPALKAAGGPCFRINSDLAEQNAAALLDFEQDGATARKGKEAAPPRPPWRQLLIQDTTIEALSDALIDNPRGVLMLADELSEWIGSMDAYTAGRVQKDRPAWLQAYEGGPRSLNRVMRGRAVVPNWSVSIAGGIQPDVVRRLLGAGAGAGDGLTQRFLVASLAPARIGADRDDDAAAGKAYRQLARGLWDIRDEPSTTTLSPEAHEVFRDYAGHIHGIAQALAGNAEAFAAHLGKWEGMLARLLLVFHAVECVGRGRHPGADQVTAVTAAAVIDLARSYLFPHASNFYGEVLAQRTHHQTAAKVADVILTKNLRSFTPRDIAEQWKGWRDLDDRYQEAVLSYLELTGWIFHAEPAAGRLGRRPTALYTVNPAAHIRFQDRADRQRSQRANLFLDWKAAANG